MIILGLDELDTYAFGRSVVRCASCDNDLLASDLSAIAEPEALSCLSW